MDILAVLAIVVIGMSVLRRVGKNTTSGGIGGRNRPASGSNSLSKKLMQELIREANGQGLNLPDGMLTKMQTFAPQAFDSEPQTESQAEANVYEEYEGRNESLEGEDVPDHDHGGSLAHDPMPLFQLPEASYFVEGAEVPGHDHGIRFPREPEREVREQPQGERPAFREFLKKGNMKQAVVMAEVLGKPASQRGPWRR